MDKVRRVLLRIGKLISTGFTNPRPKGQVKITPEIGERKSFEANLLDHPKPFVFKRTGNANHHAVRLPICYDEASAELRIRTITSKNGKIKRIYNNFRKVWEDGQEFRGYLIDGSNPPLEVRGVIILEEPTELKKAA